MRNKLIVWTCLQKKKKKKGEEMLVWSLDIIIIIKRIRENEKDKYKYLNKKASNYLPNFFSCSFFCVGECFYVPKA